MTLKKSGHRTRNLALAYGSQDNGCKCCMELKWVLHKICGLWDRTAWHEHPCKLCKCILCCFLCNLITATTKILKDQQGIFIYFPSEGKQVTGHCMLIILVLSGLKNVSLPDTVSAKESIRMALPDKPISNILSRPQSLPNIANFLHFLVAKLT